MQARVVAAGRGWQWIAEGVALYRARPSAWLALTSMLALLWTVSLLLVIGSLLFTLLMPGLLAGVLIGCRAVEDGAELKTLHLFSGIRRHASALVTLGGVYLVGTIAVFGVVLLNADVERLTMLLAKPRTDVAAMHEATRTLALALLVGAAAYLPLLMLLWFAPALVVFDGLAPVAAMRASFVACFRNTPAFLVYGAAALLLWIALSMPASFGVAGVVLMLALLFAAMPALLCSNYFSYKDVFAAPPAAGA